MTLSYFVLTNRTAHNCASVVEHESRMIRSKRKNKKKFDQFESRVVEDVH